MRKQQRRPVSTPCVQWQAQLASLHRNDLLPREREALRVHLLECSACAQAQVDYRAMDAALRSLPPVAPLPQLPRELAEAVHKQQRGTQMLKDDTPMKGITGNLEVIDLDEQLAKRARKAGSRPVLSTRPERHRSRPVRIISSLVAVLVVAVLAGGALFLFSDHSGPDSSVTGSQVPLNAKVLYTTSPEIPGQVKKASIYAVNPQNGSTYWKTTFKTKLAINELVPYKNTLFAPGEDGNLYALSAKTGKVLWKYALKDTSSGNVPDSPIAYGNTVYFSTDSGFYAVSIYDGKLLWHVAKPCKPRSANGIVDPACTHDLSAVANGKVYGFFDGLYAFDASNGKQLWHNPQILSKGSPNVVISGKYLYTIAGLHLDVLDAVDGRQMDAPALATSGEANGLLGADGVVYYSTANQFVALQGTEVLWRQNYSSALPMAFSQKTLFVETTNPLEATSKAFGSFGSYFYALDASTGKIKWHWGEKAPDGQGVWGPGYSIAWDGKLYFFSMGQVKGNKWVEGLWILHDSKRDFYPLQD